MTGANYAIALLLVLGAAACGSTTTPPVSQSATLTATPSAIEAGQSSTLTLTTPFGYHNVFINGARPTSVGCATSCTFTMTVTPAVSTTYQAAATDGSGTPYSMPRVTVTVSGATTPPPASPPPPTPPAFPTTPGALPTALLQASNLVEAGSFSTPGDVMGSCAAGSVNEFSWVNGAIAFNPLDQSLFVVGHDWCQHTGEISIPATGGTAEVVQGFTDALDGKRRMINVNGQTTKIGGLFVLGTTLHVSAYDYYDANSTATASHFTRPTKLASTSVVGPLTVGTMNPGFVGGYFSAIPNEWQAALGGDLLVGQCCLAIITRTSFGPDAFAVNSADLVAGKSPTAATPLVYYDSTHPTLGNWGPQGSVDPLYNGTTAVKGAVIIPGTASLLYFGTTGLGPFCYGAGTADKSLAGQPTPDGTIYCYDPSNSAKGTHAYPYTGYVWAYNLNELVSVRSGAKQPWQVVPYATWAIPIGPLGAAYDPATGRLFLSTTGNDSPMTVHVWNVRP